MRRSFYIKKNCLTIGLGKDKYQINQICLTPCLDLGLLDDEQKEYIDKGFSLSVGWLGLYIGISFCKIK